MKVQSHLDNTELLKEIKMKSKISRGKQTTAQVGKGILHQFGKQMA